MKFSKIQLPGTELANNEADSTDRFQIERTILVGQSTRDADARPVEIVVDDNQIYEYHFDDDTVWISDPGSIDEIFPGASERKRSLGEENVLQLPLSLPPGATSNRVLGGKKILLKILKVFVRKTGKKIIDTLVAEKAKELEDKSLFEKQGILSVDPNFQFTKGTLPALGRCLLFIHGTASSTKGSFGSISENPNRTPSAVWQSIHALYPGRVFAFEHRSLTLSPLENVLELVKELPEEVTLHLITQSRGGIVGDLLCRFVTASQTGAPPFNETEKEFLKNSECEADLRIIDSIIEAIASKRIRIEKYIRVGCPAGGTTLASKRLDTWLNVIFNIAGYAAGAVAGPAVAAFKELVLATVETKDDPDVLPGLAPQNPESAMCKTLNNPESDISIDIPLTIISGDNELTFKWRGLLNILSNLFFLAQNDFVVNTASMYKGPRRIPGRTVYFLDKGGDVTHFNYFKNTSTRVALSNALSSTGTSTAGFAPLPDALTRGADLRNISISISKGAISSPTVSGKRPIAVMLPGIMGSNLSVGNHQIWIDFARFVKGELKSLDYNNQNNKNITADSVVGDSYRKLYKYLSTEYDVLIFPFDWRRDMQWNVSLLNDKLLELFTHGQAIKLVGHSMGGVLVRDFMALFPQTLEKLNQLPGFRILLLGSPLRGSFRIASVLFGEDELIKQLALIDFKNTKKQLLETFVKFPGILGLLPHDSDSGNDFGQTVTWESMRKAHGDEKWPIPDEQSLELFAAHRDTIVAASSALDYSKVSYIAGLAGKNKGTVSGYNIEPRSTLSKKKLKLRFEETDRGDGSVTWDSGIPARLIQNKSVFYSTVTHGELANDESLFLAISEILKSGDTALLPKQEPVLISRSLDEEAPPGTRSLVTYEIDQTRDGLMSSLLGLNKPTDRPVSSKLPLRVSVTHGDLRYANNPILIGHFQEDGIWSAERAADRHLNFELSRRKWLGLYPGPVGSTLQVVPDGEAIFKGVIILGLGLLGEHNERVLQTAIEQGVKQYLVSLIMAGEKPQHDEASENAPDENEPNEEAPENVSLSSLLIGSGYGGLSLDRSLTAILTGIQNANTDIKSSYPTNYKNVTEVEFLELFQDQALAAARTLRIMERQEENRTLFVRTERKIRETMGRQQRINTGYTPTWWSRITVRRYNDNDNVSAVNKSGLYFGISTDAARVEERSLLTAGTEILSMLKEASEDHQWSPEVAKTLFELLIPNDFKTLVKKQGNIIWQLDEHTANFPWELLQDNLESGKPLSVNSGMIRQLSSQNFRLQVKMATGNNALMIADPDLKGKYYQLPNAATEGSSVGQLLTTRGFNVIRDINGNSDSILRKLYVRPYKILHLAAHGVFEYGESKSTGMLIGPDSFLTPAHINQMSETPELVFVNCCYLGKTDGKAEEFSQNRHRLAANIGTQLISNGVKAVVVAGWAVDDQAALIFADRFYEAMLAGDYFGTAVWKARRLIYDRFGNQGNTWGAYQCYGDPSYKLEIREAGTGSVTEIPEFETDGVLLMELTNLLNELDLGQDTRHTLESASNIETTLSESQRNNGQIVELFAQIYASLGDLKNAIRHYESLKLLSDAKYTVRSLEQLCNLKVKLWIQEWRANPGTASEAATKINNIIAELNYYQNIGATAERFNILGSSYKRLALLSTNEQQKEEYYQLAADQYQEAYKLIAPADKFYPLANSLLIKYVLSKRLSSKKKPNFKTEIEELERAYKIKNSKNANKDDYWSQVALCELPLYLWLVDDQESDTKKLLNHARELRKHSGHRGNWTAISEQINFLQDLFEILPDSYTKKKEKLDLIREVGDNLG